MKEEEKRQNPTLLPGAGDTVRAKATLCKNEPGLYKASMSPECATVINSLRSQYLKALLSCSNFSMPG